MIAPHHAISPSLRIALLVGSCGLGACAGSPGDETAPAAEASSGSEAAAPATEAASTSDTAAPAAAQSVAAPEALLPNGVEAIPGVVTGGKPSDAQLRAAHAAGYRTVVSLLPSDADGDSDEARLAAELGMRFVSIPVAGAQDLTEDNARALDAVVTDPEAGPILVHCGSGNRAGGLLALHSYYVKGASAEEALQLGEAAGLRGLRDAVAKRIGHGNR